MPTKEKALFSEDLFEDFTLSKISIIKKSKEIINMDSTQFKDFVLQGQHSKNKKVSNNQLLSIMNNICPQLSKFHHSSFFEDFPAISNHGFSFQ